MLNEMQTGKAKQNHIPAGWRMLVDEFLYQVPDAKIQVLNGLLIISKTSSKAAHPAMERAFCTCQICGEPGRFGYKSYFGGNMKAAGPRCKDHRGWIDVND